jgi:hypothetical protein
LGLFAPAGGHDVGIRILVPTNHLQHCPPEAAALAAIVMEQDEAIAEEPTQAGAIETDRHA